MNCDINYINKYLQESISLPYDFKWEFNTLEEFLNVYISTRDLNLTLMESIRDHIKTIEDLKQSKLTIDVGEPYIKISDLREMTINEIVEFINEEKLNENKQRNFND